MLFVASEAALAQDPPADAPPAAAAPAENPPAPDDAPMPAPVEEPPPKLDKLPRPTTQQLLAEPPRDWIVLKNEDVIITEPVSPRPNTLAVMQQAIDEMSKQKLGLTGEALQIIQNQVDELSHLYLTIPGDAEPEYRLPISRIGRIIHHEDHMVERIRAALAAEDLNSAMELLLRLERAVPDWPGVREAHDDLVFTDASLRLNTGAPEAALVLLEELRERNGEYPGLSVKAGEAVDKIAAPAVQSREFAKAHHFLLRLSRFTANHPVGQRLSADMARLAQQTLNEASAAGEEGRHEQAALLAEQAASIWPPLPALKSVHRTLTERYQRVHVGVVRFARHAGAGLFSGRAERRIHHLTTTPLFRPSRYKGGTIYYRTPFFDEWEPFDLGRRVRFRLSDARQPADVAPRLEAGAAAAALHRCLDPSDSLFDERLAAYLEAIDVTSPLELTLTFSRVPARLEPLLARFTAIRDGLPSGSTPAGGFASVPDVPLVDGGSAGRILVGVDRPGGGFVEVARTEDAAVYRRPQPEPERLKQYHVAEVVEHAYATDEHAVQALQRGDVSLLVDLPDWIVRRLQADDAVAKQCFFLPLAVPTTHVLQFNPSNQALRVRELRRALEYAIDREKILKEDVLRDPASAHGRLSYGPFPRTSYANNSQVRTRVHDPSTAIALLLVARRQLGAEIPPLRLAVAPDRVEQLAADRIITAWKRIGLKVERVDATTLDPQQPHEGWDILYRSLHNTEPVFDLWPFLTAGDEAAIGDLTPFPDWLKQDLIDLDRTADWTRAIAATQALHRRLTLEAAYIPLWELDEFVIIRKTLRNFRPEPFYPYDGVEHWNAEAFYRATLK